MENFGLSIHPSDDEAPEEETFEDSKSRALQSMEQALDTTRREKELLKEKRRRRQALFQEQKKRKLLPADVLEEISPTVKKQKQSKDEAVEEGEEVKEGMMRKKNNTRKLAHTHNVKGNYTVTMVTEQPVASFQQQIAENFIQSRLYGPSSCRTSSNELLSLQNKMGGNKTAAVQFVKKNWASKQKAKAEKLKKRWIYKQHIPSC